MVVPDTSLDAARRIWLIGGTQESAQLAKRIALGHLPCTITATTEAAKSLYPQATDLHVWIGQLDPARLPQFLQEQSICAVLDASHPYAVEISRLAIAAAAQIQIPYLRYERPKLDAVFGRDTESVPGVTHLDSFKTLLSGNYLKGRVLLTVGYKPLKLFHLWQDATLFARILPSPPALEAALAAGFTPDRLVALRPPISAEVERALWRQWQISTVVTKASGIAGGEDVKRQVAAELGVSLVAIDRPEISYPHQTSDLATALEFCRSIFYGASNSAIPVEASP